MPKVDVYDINGKKVSDVELNENVFGIEPNEAIVHEVLVNYLANQRQGTQSTKTRAEVRGGGRKPWRQKGTGRARQGSIRAPQWIKGGIALGPKPRSYKYRVNKKERQLAIRSLLSAKVLDNELTVVDKLEVKEPKTKVMAKALTDLKLDERTLKIHGKGNIERIVYLNDAVLEALTEYLKVRPSLGKDNIDYNALFISSRNKRISKRAVQSIIKEELNMTFDEAKDGLHTHTLRHTGATLMYNENDTNILVLKKVLGHKSIVATEVYTHVDPKKLKDIMENCAISSLLERKEEVMANGRN